MLAISRLASDDSGQDLIEYCFLAIFLVLAVMVGLQAVAAGLNTGYSNLGAQLGSGS
jgi:Flp pilus assembly pilin Flp